MQPWLASGGCLSGAGSSPQQRPDGALQRGLQTCPPSVVVAVVAVVVAVVVAAAVVVVAAVGAALVGGVAVA